MKCVNCLFSCNPVLDQQIGAYLLITTAQMPQQEVVICGAGPSGLLAGLFLARRGLSVTVLERRRRPAPRGSAQLTGAATRRRRAPRAPLLILSPFDYSDFKSLAHCRLATTASGSTTCRVCPGPLAPACAGDPDRDDRAFFVMVHARGCRALEQASPDAV